MGMLLHRHRALRESKDELEALRKENEAAAEEARALEPVPPAEQTPKAEEPKAQPRKVK